MLKQAASLSLTGKINQAEAVGSTRLFSIRHEFPAEWAKFKEAQRSSAMLNLNLRPEHYPFWSQNYLKKVNTIQIFALTENKFEELNKSEFSFETPAAFESPTGSYSLKFNGNSMEELWLTVKWGE